MKASINIIHGKDNFLIKERIKKAIQLIPEEVREFSVFKYFGHEVVEGELLNEVSTLPFGCDRKLIVIEEYLKIKNKNLVFKLIEETLENCSLFLWSTEIKPLAAKLKKLCDSHKQIIRFELIKAPNALDIENRIRRYLKENKFNFEEKAVQYLASQLVNQPEFLPGELEKLYLFLSHQDLVLSESRARDLLSIRDESNAFDIATFILEQNKIKALICLNNYLKNSGNLILLQAILQAEVYKLLRYKELILSNKSEKAAFGELGIHYPFLQQKLKKIANKFSVYQIYSLLNATLELEKILKSESIVNENRDSIKVNLLGRLWLLKIISIYC